MNIFISPLELTHMPKEAPVLIIRHSNGFPAPLSIALSIPRGAPFGLALVVAYHACVIALFQETKACAVPLAKLK